LINKYYFLLFSYAEFLVAMTNKNSSSDSQQPLTRPTRAQTIPLESNAVPQLQLRHITSETMSSNNDNFCSNV
jgi:hypothetical protein